VRTLYHRVRGDLTCGTLYFLDSGGGATGNSSLEGLFPPGSHRERRDFDDGANALWSLYGNEAKTHDEARFQRLEADMDGIPTFVCTVFIIDSNSFTRISTGWLVCCSSDFIPYPKYSVFAS